MIIGHQQQWDFLRKMAQQDRVPQAIIFSGEDGLGKKEMVLEFIKLLNCRAEDFNKKPCGKCQSCSLMEKNRHPDVFFIAPQDREIKISQIRGLQSAVALKSEISDFKVFVVKDAHCLNAESQNCFLKTLEEPLGRVVFALITSKPEMLFATIRSRCQNIKFYPLAPKTMSEYFSRNFQNPGLKKILLLAEGKPGIAKEFLENEGKADGFLALLKKTSKLLRADVNERFIFIKELLADKESFLKADSFLEILLKQFRWLLWKKTGLKNGYTELVDLPADYSLSRITSALKETENMRSLIVSTNVNPRLALENLMLKI